jgi:hypothetical protein
MRSDTAGPVGPARAASVVARVDLGAEAAQTNDDAKMTNTAVTRLERLPPGMVLTSFRCSMSLLERPTTRAPLPGLPR